MQVCYFFFKSVTAERQALLLARELVSQTCLIRVFLESKATQALDSEKSALLSFLVLPRMWNVDVGKSFCPSEPPYPTS